MLRILTFVMICFLLGPTPVYARRTLWGEVLSTLKGLSQGVEQYKTDYGVPPPVEPPGNSKSTTSLVIYLDGDPKTVGAGGGNTSINYFEFNQRFIINKLQYTDPWGHPIIYRYPGKHGDFDIYSVGADGIDQDGACDDISNWAGVNDGYYYKKSWTAELIISLCILITLIYVAYLSYKRKTCLSCILTFAMIIIGISIILVVAHKFILAMKYRL